MRPFPLMERSPNHSNASADAPSRSSSARAAALSCRQPGTPCDSMRLAVFTCAAARARMREYNGYAVGRC